MKKKIMKNTAFRLLGVFCLSFYAVDIAAQIAEEETLVLELKPDSTMQSQLTVDSLPAFPVFEILADDPILEALDKMIVSHHAEKNCFISDSVALNVYNYPSGFIPDFDTATYVSRLDFLDERTPFSLIYNIPVHKFIELYAFKRREQVSRMLGLAELYFPMIEDMLDQYNLPLELKYLAIVESALNPQAKSRAGATGMWQFMYRTGKIYDLDVTTYIDERSDPYKATIAACKYLSFLYGMFNDWDLVLAAYNSGPGNVNRAIRKSGGKRNYWALWPYLPKETRGYVPAFIAVNYIMNYASEHNIYPVPPKFFSYEVDTITLNKKVTFDQLAEVLCIPKEDLQYLNPVYKTDVIPFISGERFVITLPVEAVGDFINNEDIVYNYKSPEEYEKEMREIAAMANEQKTKPEPVTKPVQDEKKETMADEAISEYIYHTIQPGDTLWDIAKKYDGVTVSQIRQLNNLGNVKKLKPGMKIKIAVSG